jgi:tRNA threonylcarbamoyladenosine biosynthesis protein TsaE
VRHADAPGTLERLTQGADDTRALAATLGALLRAGDLVLLEGGLGAGKTVFVQGLARGLGHDATVKSPTFTLMNEYGRGPATAAPGARRSARTRLAHLDLYRIPPGRDLTDLALDELLDRACVAVEWGGRLAATYPDHVHVALDEPDPAARPDRRRVVFDGRGERGVAIVAALGEALAAGRA